MEPTRRDFAMMGLSALAAVGILVVVYAFGWHGLGMLPFLLALVIPLAFSPFARRIMGGGR